MVRWTKRLDTMNQASAVVDPGQSSAQADRIASEIALTIPGLFRLRAARSGEDLAYRQFEEASGTWRDYSWGEMDRLVACWRHALRGEALTAGDRVAVLLRNSVEWVCFDLAAQSLGLVMVPLFPTDTPGNIAYVLADSGARLLLVGTADAWRSLAAHRAALPSLRRVLCLGPVPLPDTDGMLRPVAGWLPDRPQECPEPDLHPEGLATLIYTSGTTGRPKGVMISHRNLLSVAEAILERNPGTRNDVFLSYLPLAHCFERVAGYYVPMMIGANISFARSIDHLPEDLLIIRPTILLVVPRVLERIYRRGANESPGTSPCRLSARSDRGAWSEALCNGRGRTAGHNRRRAADCLAAAAPSGCRPGTGPLGRPRAPGGQRRCPPVRGRRALLRRARLTADRRLRPDRGNRGRVRRQSGDVSRRCRR